MSDGQTPGPIRIVLERAKQLYSQGKATILEVVDSESYAELSYRIKGIVRINPEDIKDQYTRLPRDRHTLAC